MESSYEVTRVDGYDPKASVAETATATYDLELCYAFAPHGGSLAIAFTMTCTTLPVTFGCIYVSRRNVEGIRNYAQDGISCAECARIIGTGLEQSNLATAAGW